MQIDDGIWQVDELRASNVYIVAIDGGAVIIDSGLPGSTDTIVQELRRAGFAPDDVRLLVITHAHTDHIGSVAALHRLTGAPIAASHGEALATEGRTPLPSPSGVWGVLMRPSNILFRPEPTEVHIRLQPDTPIAQMPGWFAVGTPGHTPEHLSLYHPQREWLITGDALANLRGVRRSPRPVTSDMIRAQASVAKLAGLAVRHSAFGHGSPILDDPGLTDRLAALARADRSRQRTALIAPHR